MTTYLKNPKVIAGIATALFMVSLIGFMNVYKVNSSLEGNLKEEKLRSESLLSEKLLLAKDIEKFKTQLSALTGTNENLDKALADASGKLAAREAEYNKVLQQNASMKNIKKQHDALVAMRKNLEETIATLTNAMTRLQMENKELSGTIASLEQRNSYLMKELERAQWASLDQPRIEATKGKKEKLTVVARKTKKMKVNFDVPADLKDLSFHIIDPKGSMLTNEDGTIASRYINDDSSLLASSDANVAIGKKHKQVEMVYLANKKLQPGIYKIEILSENLYVGSLQVKLK